MYFCIFQYENGFHGIVLWSFYEASSIIQSFFNLKFYAIHKINNSNIGLLFNRWSNKTKMQKSFCQKINMYVHTHSPPEGKYNIMFGSNVFINYEIWNLQGKQQFLLYRARTATFWVEA